MLSTLLPKTVPVEDAELVQRLDREIGLIDGDGTETLFRFGVANEAGELYRMVLVFGFQKRKRALEIMREMGYRDEGPRPDRHLDAVFLPGPLAAVE